MSCRMGPPACTRCRSRCADPRYAGVAPGVGPETRRAMYGVAGRANNSGTVDRWVARPCSTTTTSSARAATSSKPWVTTMVGRPSRSGGGRARRAPRRAPRRREPRAARRAAAAPGSAASARASATRCACPPESWAGRCGPARRCPSRSSHAAACGRRSAFATRCERGPNATLSSTRQVREQQVVLEHVADAALLDRQLVEHAVAEADRCRRSGRTAGERGERGRLARAVRVRAARACGPGSTTRSRSELEVPRGRRRSRASSFTTQPRHPAVAQRDEHDHRDDHQHQRERDRGSPDRSAAAR